MTPLSTKTVALAAVIALGSLMSSSAHAAILHTVGGEPAMTSGGAAVLIDDSFGCGACQADQYTEVVYFDFNKSVLTKQYKDNVSQAASKIRANGNKNVTVVGFADRMGNAAYNEKLALNRAKTVRDLLVAKGVKSSTIEVRSLGNSVAKTSCAADLPRAKMISCLQEDRRVEIEVK